MSAPKDGTGIKRGGASAAGRELGAIGTALFAGLMGLGVGCEPKPKAPQPAAKPADAAVKTTDLPPKAPVKVAPEEVVPVVPPYGIPPQPEKPVDTPPDKVPPAPDAGKATTVDPALPLKPAPPMPAYGIPPMREEPSKLAPVLPPPSDSSE